LGNPRCDLPRSNTANRTGSIAASINHRTIGIAEEDRPRRWRAHRNCTNGWAVSLINSWVVLAPKAGRAWGGRRRLLSSGTALLVGAPGRCSGRRAQLKPPFPVPIRRDRSYAAPSAPGSHSPRRCRVNKRTHMLAASWSHRASMCKQEGGGEVL
jgi:hypothetical protein